MDEVRSGFEEGRSTERQSILDIFQTFHSVKDIGNGGEKQTPGVVLNKLKDMVLGKKMI